MKSQKMTWLPRLKLEVEGVPYHLTGGESDEMLAVVKRLPDRLWGANIGRGNVWILKGAIADVRAALAPLQVFESENELSQAELLFVESVRAQVLNRESEIQAERERLLRVADVFSLNSKSPAKAAALRDADCLICAIMAAKKPIKDLTGFQALSLVRALRLMDSIIARKGLLL